MTLFVTHISVSYCIVLVLCFFSLSSSAAFRFYRAMLKITSVRYDAVSNYTMKLMYDTYTIHTYIHKN